MEKMLGKKIKYPFSQYSFPNQFSSSICLNWSKKNEQKQTADKWISCVVMCLQLWNEVIS